MERNILLTSIHKYRLVILALLSLLVLGGCGNNFTPIDSSTVGFFDHYFVYPFSLLIKKVAFWLEGNYGAAIILITISIRFLLMPLFIRQSKNSKASQEKMAMIKPEMEEIQKKYKGKKSTEDQLSMQRELGELYRKTRFQSCRNSHRMLANDYPNADSHRVLLRDYANARNSPTFIPMV